MQKFGRIHRGTNFLGEFGVDLVVLGLLFHMRRMQLIDIDRKFLGLRVCVVLCVCLNGIGNFCVPMGWWPENAG